MSIEFNKLQSSQKKMESKERNQRKSFADMVSNLKLFFNRHMPLNSSVSRAKVYLTNGSKGAATSKRTNWRDSAKTVQAKFVVQASTQQRMPTWAELIGDQVLSEYNLRFQANFPCQVFNTISEAQQFEKLGFSVSPVLRTSILRKEQLFEDATTVSEMINRYNRIVAGLPVAKVSVSSLRQSF